MTATVTYWLAMLVMAAGVVALRRALVRELARVRAFRPRHDIQTASKLPHWRSPIGGRDREACTTEPPARPSPQHLADPLPWLNQAARVPSILVRSIVWRQGTGRRVALAPAPSSSWFWRPVCS